jgi:trehalose/maltose hydrolase-like predicted phosphorylase
MLHHERLRPPIHDYPADEWNIVEKRFHPEFLAQSETMLALGNGYLGRLKGLLRVDYRRWLGSAIGTLSCVIYQRQGKGA